MLETFDPNDIQDLEGARRAILHLLNLVEEMVSENRTLREENQRLRDEINRLKGETGKPVIQPNRKPRATSPSDHSSEPARRQQKKRTRHSKVQHIQIDRECFQKMLCSRSTYRLSSRMCV
jgi:regulator of replication initiation timing